MKPVERPSPNCDSRGQDERGDAVVDMLVLHYTGMKTVEAALERLCDPDAKVSAHYTVDESGTVYAHVPEARRAWHAGLSFWGGATDVNARSIGIELVNPGHEFGYRAFPEAQIAALITLCHGILSRHPIPAARVLGHSDVAPARKEDPGELFPWQTLAKAGVGLWPDRIESDLGADALARYGYDPEAPAEKVITAFQRHFRPRKLDGKWDGECAGLLAGLIAATEQVQLIDRLVKEIPDLAAVFGNHVKDNDEILPHVFFGDLTRYVQAELGRNRNASVRHVLLILEEAISNEKTRNLVEASFLENLEHAGEFSALVQLAGPKMKAALLSELNRREH